MANIPHLPDMFELRMQQGCMGQSDSLDTPAEVVESDESYEASAALLNADRVGQQPPIIKN